MNSIENLQWRYATKKFDNQKQLSQQQIDVLAQAFNLTATSYGLQPCRMVVVTSESIKSAMVEMAYGQRQVADASAVLVLCTTNVDQQYILDYFKLVHRVRQTPQEILQPFQDQLTQSFNQKQVYEIEQWSVNQVYIALGNLLAVCAQERIDSCPMEGFIPEKVDDLLGLNDLGMRSVLLLPVGYRAPDDMFADLQKVRLPQQKTVTFV